MKRTKFPQKQNNTNNEIENPFTELSEIQKRFVKEYVVDFNAPRAFVAAGYSQKSSPSYPYVLLRDEKIKDAIQKEIDAKLQRIEITQDHVIYELAKIAFSDISNYIHWDEHGNITVVPSTEPNLATSAISEFQKTKNGNVVRIKMYDKIKALELLGRCLGMFTDKLELRGEVKKTNEYHIIQEIVNDPRIASRVVDTYRQTVDGSTSRS